jgi:hypothetical protein
MPDLPPLRPLPPDDEADLAELAAGRLDRRRAAALEARLAADPDLAAALGAQRIAVHAIRGANASTMAPAGLRARIEALPSTAPPPRIVRPGRRRRGPAPALALARTMLGLAGAAAASLVLAVALVLSGGGPAPEDALAFAGRPAAAAARPDPGTPQLLRESAGGVRFPDYAGKFGWRAAGTRTDALEGRSTRTVFYARGDRRIAYTIVGGEPLEVPDDARPVARDGVRLHVLEVGSARAAVTWRRGGRTCVLSGDAVPAGALLELAAWKGKGAVAF